MIKGNHLYLANHGKSIRMSSMDKVKILFADKLSTGNQNVLSNADQSTSPISQSNEELSIGEAASLDLKSGWALKVRQKAIRFPPSRRTQ